MATGSAKKRNTTRSSSSKRSTAKKNTATKNAKRNEVDMLDEIFLLFVLAVAVLLFLSNLKLIGTFGMAVSGVMFGLMGVISYIFPIALFFIAIYYVANKGVQIPSVKIGAMIVLLIVLSTFAHLLFKIDAASDVSSALDYFSMCKDARSGGGLFGSAVGQTLYKLIGKAGTYIVLIVLLIISVILISEKSLFRALSDGTRNINDRMRERSERNYSEREEYDEIRRQRRSEIDEERRLRRQARREERDLRIEEKNVEKQLRRERRLDNIQKNKSEIEERQLKRTEKKVSGVSIDTTIYDNDINSDEQNLGPNNIIKMNDDVHEITVDTEGFDFSNITVRNEHAISVNPEEMNEMLSSYTDAPSAFIPKDDDYKRNRDYSEISRRKSFDDDLFDDTQEPEESHYSEPEFDLFYDNKVYQENEGIPSSFSREERVEERKAEFFEPLDRTPTVVKNDKKDSINTDTISRRTVDTSTRENKKVSKSTGRQKAYRIPPVNLLEKGSKTLGESDSQLKAVAERLRLTLQDFGINVKMTMWSQGPTVTRFEMQPERGVKVAQIKNLADDIALSMEATDVRIEAPIPGKPAVGIEVPNKTNSVVKFRDLIETDEFRNADSKISFAVGKDIEGKAVVTDIAKMPHLLIAGSTGSGKSVCINTLIMSILYKANPDEVKLIMVDPKVVELSVYNDIPHLMIPVVTDPKKAAAALQWAVNEMTDRYNKFAEYKVRDMKGYNKRVTSGDFDDVPEDERPEKMPQIVIIIDELADLMMVASKDVETSICRLAQLARAAGIHLIVATQRPTSNVITGLIKANMPSRIAFAVSSGLDSRVILDTQGAERLLGKGDMLFYPQGYNKPARLQGAFVSDDEVSKVVAFIKDEYGEVSYSNAVLSSLENGGSTSSQASASGGNSESEYDDLFVKAAQFIMEKDKASIGMLQRAFKIGFNRAARIMDQLSEAGVVGEEEGTKPRKILMGPEQFEQFVEENL